MVYFSCGDELRLTTITHNRVLSTFTHSDYGILTVNVFMYRNFHAIFKEKLFSVTFFVPRDAPLGHTRYTLVERMSYDSPTDHAQLVSDLYPFTKTTNLITSS